MVPDEEYHGPKVENGIYCNTEMKVRPFGVKELRHSGTVSDKNKKKEQYLCRSERNKSIHSETRLVPR